jgi:O-antigen/teichoic acid export membrane protein
VPERKLSEKLISNMLFNFLGQAYILALGLAVVPYVIHRVGPGLYGVLVMVATLGGFGGALNLGMGSALAKYTAQYQGQGRGECIRPLFQTAFAICLLGGLAAFSLVIGFRVQISAALFHGDPEAQPFIQSAFWVAAFGLLLWPLTEVLSALPIGFQRFDTYNRVNVLVATARNLGMVLVLALGLHVKAVFLVYLCSTLVNLLAYLYCGLKLVPGLSLRPKLLWSYVRQLVWYSAPVLITGLAGLVVIRLDRVLVAYFLTISAVSYYAVSYSLAEKTYIGVGNITSVIFPSTSELSAIEAQQKLRELYVRATKMVILAGLPVTITVLTFAAPILRWWVGPEFAIRGALTLRLLAGGFLVNILAHVPSVVAQGIGRPWISAKFALLNAATNFAFFLLLIPRFGIVGAGGGFLISELLVMPFFIWEMNRALHISWWCLTSQSYVRPFSCGLAALGVLWALQPYATSLLSLVLCCALGLGVYALLAFVTAIDSRERSGLYCEVLRALRLPGGVANA